MQPVDIVNIVLQSTIVIFLIWYAIETYRLRKQTTYQNKISIQPIIDFIHDPNKLLPFVYTIENVGFGVALNIHIYLWVSGLNKFYGLPEVQRPSIIKPDQQYTAQQLKEIDSLSIKQNQPKLAKLINDMPSREGGATLVAVYEDAAGNVYCSQQYSAHPSSGGPFSFGPLQYSKTK